MTEATTAPQPQQQRFAPVDPPERLLMGPGPSNPHPAVLRAASAPVLGHLDPAYLEILGETAEMLRQVFNTRNALTLAVPGTGFSGMEASLCNLLEPGDTLLVGAAGFFGAKMADLGARCGAHVTTVNGEWGKPIAADALRSAARELGQVKVIAIVLAETSTGVQQPLADIAALAHDIGALLVVDAVTALGGDRPSRWMNWDSTPSIAARRNVLARCLASRRLHSARAPRRRSSSASNQYKAGTWTCWRSSATGTHPMPTTTHRMSRSSTRSTPPCA